VVAALRELNLDDFLVDQLRGHVRCLPLRAFLPRVGANNLTLMGCMLLSRRAVRCEVRVHVVGGVTLSTQRLWRLRLLFVQTGLVIRALFAHAGLDAGVQWQVACVHHLLTLLPAEHGVEA